nr:AAC_HP1_G0006610.mRNA.1.CDS.1 [Saccharomyces cerevisiae]
MEFVESFLIFFYGSTNIFLEHLAGNGGAWTAKDLQHVSIAFMFIGTDLCGLLTGTSSTIGDSSMPANGHRPM